MNPYDLGYAYGKRHGITADSTDPKQLAWAVIGSNWDSYTKEQSYFEFIRGYKAGWLQAMGE